MGKSPSAIRNRVVQNPVVGAIVVGAVFGLGYLIISADADAIRDPESKSARKVIILDGGRGMDGQDDLPEDPEAKQQPENNKASNQKNP
jgi:hypothetical protein